MADDKKTVIVRFLLDLQAEEASFVDVEFNDDKQAKRAISAVLGANGALISLTNASDMPVLLRTQYVAAAFPVEYENENDDD